MDDASALDERPGTDEPAVPARTLRLPRVLLVGLAAAGLLAALLVWGVTGDRMREAPPDSIVYLSTAEHLRTGQGLTTPFDTLFDHYGPRDVAGFGGAVPLVVWSPVYPAALAAVEAVVTQNGNDAARLLNLLAQVATVVLGGLIVFSITRSSLRAVLAAVVLAALPGLLMSATFTLSDTLFVAIALAALLATRWFAARPKPLPYVVLLALSLLGVATRLAGIALPVAIGAALVVATRSDWRRRLLPAAGIVAPSLLFSFAWTSRDPAPSLPFHPPGLVDLRTFTGTVTGWIGTGDATALRVLAVVVIILLFVVAALIVWRTVAADPDRVLVIAVGFWTAASGLVLLFTRTFVDARVAFNTRLLLPVEVGLVLLLACARIPASRVLNRLLAGALLVVAAFAVFPWADRGSWRAGLVLTTSTTAEALTQSLPAAPTPAIAQAVRQLGPGTIVADYPENVWNDAGRPSIHLPSRLDITGGTDNAQFAEQLRQMRALLRPGDHIVLYQCPPKAYKYPTLDAIVRLVPVTFTYRADDGCILRVTA